MIQITKNQDQTFALGQQFAQKLKGGEVVLLLGDLGAGKTVFAKGVANGLGVKGVVNSPTFVIMKFYKTQSPKPKASAFAKASSFAKAMADRSADKQNKSKIQKLNSKNLRYASRAASISCLVHIDTYRGIDLEGLKNIGALEHFGQARTVCVVEWGAGLEEYLNKNKIKGLKVEFKMLTEKEREISFRDIG